MTSLLTSQMDVYSVELLQDHNNISWRCIVGYLMYHLRPYQ